MKKCGIKTSTIASMARHQGLCLHMQAPASGSNDPYTSVSALELARVALVPLVQRPPAPQGRLDARGALRVVVRWPSQEELLTAVFDSIRQYGLEHPAVVRGGLDLAERLASASTSPDIRRVLTRDVQDLLEAYRASDPDSPDLRSTEARADEVLTGLAE